MTAAPLRGRVHITARAQEKVFAALAADELGVPAASAKAVVGDDRGRIAARITAPVRVAPGGASVIERIGAARNRVSAEGARLTGAEIASVAVRVNAVRTSSGGLS